MHDLAELLMRLDQRLARIEDQLAAPIGNPQLHKEWFTVPEAAKVLGKKPFTIREWCRLRRINARKRKCGRGRTTEWIISLDELQRYTNDGLLPY